MSGLPEGTVVDIRVTKPGEETIESNMRVTSGDLEMAEELGVPVILHPADVKADVAKEYYQGGNIDPIISIMLSGSAIGWHYETGVAYLRLAVSGLLDRHPDLKLIMGHWGEVIPYYFDRLDMVLGNLAKGKLEHSVSYYFKKMYVMPSGMIPADENAKPEIDTDFRTCLDFFVKIRELMEYERYCRENCCEG